MFKDSKCCPKCLYENGNCANTMCKGCHTKDAPPQEVLNHLFGCPKGDYLRLLPNTTGQQYHAKIIICICPTPPPKEALPPKKKCCNISGDDAHFKGCLKEEAPPEWQEKFWEDFWEFLLANLGNAETQKLLAFIRTVAKTEYERGYQSGITDKKVWNGVYQIGAEEARAQSQESYEALKSVIEGQKKVFATMLMEARAQALKQAIEAITALPYPRDMHVARFRSKVIAALTQENKSKE